MIADSILCIQNGNETTVSGQAATYDFQNHLASVGTSTYAYDADGNRLSVTTGGVTTGYLVDPNTAFARVVEEYAGGSLQVRYDYGDDLIRQDRTSSGGVVSYFLYDGLGSVRQLTGSTGTITDTYLYDAFGVSKARTGTTKNPFQFQGQQLDAASGDYYLRARYYDPTIGRFLSQDPFAGTPLLPISLHRYLYSSDDPVNNADPGGAEDGSIGATVAAESIDLTLDEANFVVDTTIVGQINGTIAVNSAASTVAESIAAGSEGTYAFGISAFRAAAPFIARSLLGTTLATTIASAFQGGGGPASGLDGSSEDGLSRYLFHYSTDNGILGIVGSGQILPSLSDGPRAMYGKGQYLTDLPPFGLLTRPEYSIAFYSSPFVQQKVNGWVLLDLQGVDVNRVADVYTTGIDPGRQSVVKGYGVYLHPSTLPLNIEGKIVDFGNTIFHN